MHIKKISARKTDILVFILALLAAAFIFIFNKHDFNAGAIFLPIVYGLCYIFVLAPLRKKTNSKTVMWFSVAEFIRLVFVPCFEAINEYVGFYGFSTYDSVLLARADFLMSYECVFLSIFLLVVLCRKKEKSRKSEIQTIEQNNWGETSDIVPLGNDKIALIIVFLLGILLYSVVPEVHRYINFMFLDSNSTKVRGLTAGMQSTLDVGLISFTYYALLCGFIITLDYAKRKYDLSGKRRYVVFASVIGLLIISIINGESRSVTIFTLYAVIACLRVCFKKYSKTITRIFVVSGVVVLMGLSIYRLFTVYKYSSYIAAVQGASLRDNYFQSFIEMYCLGPQSIACGIQFSDTVGGIGGKFTIGTFLSDIFRPFLGFNFIAKLLNARTSIMMYNSWFSGVEGKSNGIYFQISNQGYCYFNFVLAPIFACVFLGIAIHIENKLKTKKSMFLIFFLNYVFIRAATCVISGTMSDYISSISKTLIIIGFIYLIQKIWSSTIKKK